MATSHPLNQAPFSVTEVISITGGTLAQRGRCSEEIIGVAVDSRNVVSGGMFVPLRGEHHDGHDFAVAAASKEACLLLVERTWEGPYPPGVHVVAVENTLICLGQLAQAHLRAWRARSRNTRVLGMTGSAGKTTTKELCALLLSAVAETHSTKGNLNNHIGLPLVGLGVTSRHRFVVMEMGMSNPGEIHSLSAIAEPDIGVLLNVGLAHAEGIGGGHAHIAREKGSLLDALPCSGSAIINRDDPWAYGERQRSRAQLVSFGSSVQAQYRLLERVPQGIHGAKVVFARPREQGREEHCTLLLPFVGKAVVLDFLAALAAAEAAWGQSLPLETIASALAQYTPLSGRALLTRLWNGALLLDDSYNANPTSMQEALFTLQEMGNKESRRTVAVVGEMRELGPFALDAHDTLGHQLIKAGVHLVIGCGGLVNRALAIAQKAGVEGVVACNTEEALAVLDAKIHAQDIVLIKSSLSVGTWRISEALKERGETAM